MCGAVTDCSFGEAGRRSVVTKRLDHLPYQHVVRAMCLFCLLSFIWEGVLLLSSSFYARNVFAAIPSFASAALVMGGICCTWWLPGAAGTTLNEYWKIIGYAGIV